MDSTGTGIKAIVIDLGGVLVSYDHGLITKALSSLSGRPETEVDALIFASRLEESYDRGLETSEFLTSIRTLLQFQATDEEIKKAWNEIFAENSSVTALLPHLATKAPLYLLSNTNELHFEYIKEKFQILGSFKELFLSYKLGTRKPEPEMFEHVIKSTGVTPGELFYIDDKDDFVQAARSLDIQSYHYTGPDALMAELSGRGLL